jgi:hypothetical protein
MARLARRTLLVVALLALAAGGAWLAWRWPVLALQYRIYRIGAANSAAEAARELAWFQSQPQRDEKLRELCAAWGDGNPAFDARLAEYLERAECSDALREAFALEFARRPGLVARWAHWWHWRQGAGAAEEIQSLTDYLAALATEQPPRDITWREVLDVQAAMALTGQPQLAERLEPAGAAWVERYRRWIDAHAEWAPPNEPPPAPLPDWPAEVPFPTSNMAGGSGSIRVADGRLHHGATEHTETIQNMRRSPAGESPIRLENPPSSDAPCLSGLRGENVRSGAWKKKVPLKLTHYVAG